MTEADRKAWEAHHAERQATEQAREKVTNTGSKRIRNMINISTANIVDQALNECRLVLSGIFNKHGVMQQYGYENLQEAQLLARQAVTMINHLLNTFSEKEVFLSIRSDTDEEIIKFWASLNGQYGGAAFAVDHPSVGKFVRDETLGWGRVMGVSVETDINLVLIQWLTTQVPTWEMPETYPLTYDAPEASE